MTETRAPTRLFLAGGLLILLIAILLIAINYIRRKQVGEELQARQIEAMAGPRVPVAVAGRSSTERTISLSGEARPYAEVTLYAKVSGYLSEIRVDKGDRVKQGQLLAIIESPELDRQYDAAVADAHSKRLFADRNKLLVRDGVVSQQDYDTAEASARTAEATAQSLKVQKGYENIRAPFNGTITSRFADPGALLQSAATSQTAALPVVVVSQTDRLRVYIYLDQKNAAFVRYGDRVLVADAARPDVRQEARVSRISGELDSRSRTLLVEVDLDNRTGLFLSGGFVQVTLTLLTPAFVQVPAEALLMRGEKALVGVVDGNNRVSFRPVTVVDSDGKAVRIGTGLLERERVVLNPGTGIIEGSLVQPVGDTGK